MIANPKRIEGISFDNAQPSAIKKTSTPITSGQKAWDNFKATSAVNAIQTTPTGRKKWEQFKYDSAQKVTQEMESMTGIDYFDPVSIATLGSTLGDVTYEQLMQLAYDGKIKITDPGKRKRLVVSWNPGWNASNYATGAGRLGAGSMDQNTAEEVRGLIDAMVEQKRTGSSAVYDYIKPLVDAANNANANRQEEAPTWLEVIEGAITQGGASVVDAIGATLYALEDNIILKPLEWLTGVETQGLFENPYKNFHQTYSEKNAEYQQMLGNGDQAQQFVGKYLPVVTAAVPQVLLALATSGASTATTATLQATSTAAQMTGTAATVLAIANTAKQFAMNPSFQYAFASTFGNEYMQAKEDGASDAEAYLYAMLASTVNAAVEVGGGIEGDLDVQKPLLREWAKTAIEEGGEEVVQGIISQAFQNAVYNKGNALVSLTDENAVLSGKRAAEEFTGGAIVGGLHGVGQVAMQAYVNKKSGVKNNWLKTPQNPAVSGSLSGNTQTQEQGEKTATDAGAKAAGTNTQSDTTTEQQERAIKAILDAIPKDSSAEFASKLNSAVEFIAAGDDVMTATVKGQVMDRVLAGDQTLTNTELRRLALNSSTTRQVFEKMLGTPLPMTTDTTTLLNAVRSVIKNTYQKKAAPAESASIATDAEQNKTAPAEEAGEQVQESAIEEIRDPGFYPSESFDGTESDRKYLDNLAKAVGVSIEMTSDDNGNNGWIIDDKVYISESTEDPVLVVAKHEITHRIQQAAGDAYTKYRNFVEKILRERGGLDLKIKMVQELYASRGQQLTREQALDELAADFAGELLENETLIRRIANQDRNLAQRIFDYLRDLIRRIKSAFGDTETRKLDRAAQLWEAALQEANIAYKRGVNAKSDEPRYSFQDSNIEKEMDTSHEGRPEKTGGRSNYGGFTISADKITHKKTDVNTAESVQKKKNSVKGSREAQRRIDALERQNKRLKDQLKRTDVPKVRRDIVKRSAKDLRSLYSSRIDADALATRIEDLYNKIAKYSGVGTLQDVKGIPSWKEIKAESSSIAYAILAESSANTNTTAEEYNEFRKELKGRKISISEKYRSDLESAGGYEGIRKKNFGTFTLSKEGTPIESVYMELSEKYPELFPDDIFHPADQLIRLSDVLEDLKPIMGNPFEADLDNTAKYLSGEIIERFYDTPNEAPTKADKMEYAYHRQRMKDQKEFRARLEKQKKAYEQQAEDLQKKYEKENLERIERQNAAQRRETIYRNAFRLGKKLARPTNKQHVPEELRGVALELVQYINLESGFEYEFGSDAEFKRVKSGSAPFPVKTNRSMAALNLKKQLDEIAKSEALSVDPDLDEYLQEIANMGDKTLSEMTKAELDTVWNVLQIVEHLIVKANNLHAESRYKNLAAMAKAVAESVSKTEDRKSFVGPVGAVDKLLNFDMLTPETFLHKLGPAGDELFKMMRKAEDQQILIIGDGVEYASKLVKESGVDFSKLDKELHTFKLTNGTLTLSTSQIMELYALMNRQQARDHILKGGLKSIGAVKGSIELRNSRPVKVNSADVAEIISKLTDKQKKLVDGLQMYMSSTLAEYGNAETMKVYGYKKFKEKNYWPIKVASTEVASDPVSKTHEKMIPSYGMTKLTLPKAKNPVELRSAIDSFANHLNQMSTYASWLGVNEDITRLLNFQYLGNDLEVNDTVKRLLESVYGKNGEKYLDNLLGDIAQGTKAGRDKAITEALTGNWKAAKVGANLRVIVQQPTAVLRAMDELDPKYFLAGGSPKKGWEKAKKHSQIAQWKDWGYFEINTGRSLRELAVGTEDGLDKIRNVSMWAAGAADSMTWGYLWNAVEKETSDLHPELEKGSDEFYKAVAERFGEIVGRTQVVDSVLHRTQIMRSSNALDKMATNFMGEPSKVYNMVARRIFELTNATTETERKRAIAATARTVGSLTASFALNALVQSLVDALRDDDRDKEYGEKFAENLFGITGEEDSAVEMWNNFWDGNFAQNYNLLSYIPYIKDILSVIKGYSVDRTDMAAVSDIVSALMQFGKSISGDGQKTVFAAGMDALSKAGDLLGIPVSNIKREIESVINTVLNDLELFELQYAWDKLIYNEENAASVFYGDLYRSMNADLEAYESIYDDFYQGMIESGMDKEEAESKVKSAMESKMKDDIGVQSTKSLPVRWSPPTEKDSLDVKTQKFFELLRLGEETGGWASQLPEGAVELAHEVDAARDETNLDRLLIIANGYYDEWVKELLASNNLEEAAYTRYMSARGAKVSTKDYFNMLARADEIAKQRGAKNASQKDIQAALNESNLTKAQKRAIWNSYIDTGVWKTESPW